MKKLIQIFALALLLLTIQNSRALGQKRIQFEKGKSSAVVQSTTGSTGTAYVLRAKSGQMLVLTLTPRTGVGIRVETDGRYGQQVLLREEKGGSFEVGLEESGDYTIFLGSTNGKSASFTLSIKIRKMTDI